MIEYGVESDTEQTFGRMEEEWAAGTLRFVCCTGMHAGILPARTQTYRAGKYIIYFAKIHIHVLFFSFMQKENKRLLCKLVYYTGDWLRDIRE